MSLEIVARFDIIRLSNEREVSDMRYAIYLTWEDGFEDSIIETGAYVRDLSLKELKEREDIVEVSYCKIYKSGEYCKRIKVK